METLKFALYIKHDMHEFKEAAKIHYTEACKKLAYLFKGFPNAPSIHLASNLSSFFRSAGYFILPEAMPVIVFGISSISLTIESPFTSSGMGV